VLDSIVTLGQRLFFLHDGRATDLVDAIRAHRSPATTRYRASEANVVTDRFRAMARCRSRTC
jgi:hypothetical protein